MDESLGNLLLWFDLNKRDLPWRATKDPYQIWISEVMLQQTNVKTALPHYVAWMTRFPNVSSVTQVTVEELAIYWQGLGYYRRLRDIYKTAILLDQILRLNNNLWPKTSDEWLKFPGIGKYTANAIVSIAFGAKVPVVDGNVKRVFARITDCHEQSTSLEKLAWNWATEKLHPGRPGDWNQALMELGATVCTPKTPICRKCPLSEGCLAFKYGTQLLLPEPNPKQKPLEVMLHFYFIYKYQNSRLKFLIVYESESRWWQGLWGLPYQANEKRKAERELPPIKHTVTNHKLTIIPLLIKFSNELWQLECQEKGKWVGWEDLNQYPLSSAHKKAIQSIRTLLLVPGIVNPDQ